ncbi:MAG TPA: TonB-dependent receptor [Bryobacteraceae bacterium]|nr:TonB-dependent receptor [Bryobacteraceae bacterium]
MNKPIVLPGLPIPGARLAGFVGLIALFFIVMHPVGMFAQSAGFGTVSGVVLDSSGSPVPGAKIVIENASKGIRRELTTTADGNFNAPGLVPASGYEVHVTAAGFAGYDVTDVTVAVGESVTINAALTVASAATTVDVTAEAPVIDSTKTDVSQLVTSKQIVDLPINGRRVDSFVLLTPGVTTDGAFGLLSFRGTPGGNSFLTDGIDTTNAFYDENAGRTRTFNISQDAVQEFQVVSANFLAEYGHASGGVVNTVTRSGSNDFHGTGYWFFRNRTLNATDITANGINPPEWRHQAGASVGGPIKKDKLFFFFNGELQRRNEPIVSSNIITAVTNGVVDTNGNFLQNNPVTKVANCNTAVATQAQCTNAINYFESRIRPQLIPRGSDVNLLFGKIDYRPSERSSFSVFLNYLDFRSPNGIQTQLSLTAGDAVGNNADTNVFDRTLSANWTYVVTPTAINEFKFGFFKDRQFDPASPSLLPSFGPETLTVSSVSNVGYANGYPRLNPSEARYQLADTFSLTWRNHNFKFGVDWDHVEDFVSRLANRYGTYTYSSNLFPAGDPLSGTAVTPFTLFALDFSGNTTGGKHYSSYSQAFGNPLVDVNMPEIAWFLQDEWRVTPKLTITPGIRFEYAWIPQPGNPNPAFPQTARVPNNGVNFGPRFGIAYALNEKTAIRAGFGLFQNRYTTSTIENAFITNGVYQASYSLFSLAQINAGGPVFPNPLAAPPNVNGTSSILYLDSHWRNPYSEQANIAVERQLAKDTSLTVSYVWSRGIHLLDARDANAAAPTTSQTFPVLDASGNVAFSYTTPLYTTRINPAYGTITELDSASNSYYNAGILQLTRRFSGWLQGNIAYTYSHAIDYNVQGGGNTLFGSTFPTSVFNGDYRDEKGSSSIDQRHRLVFNGIASPKFVNGDTFVDRYLINNWQLSVVSLAASSQPLVPTINVSARPPGILSSFSLNGLGGSGRVPFESISALNIGPTYRTDARLAKLLPISERFKVYLMFEAFNVFNHVIVSGSSPRVTTQYTSLTRTINGVSQIALVPTTNYGAILQTQFPPDGTTARRAQAAIRLVF